MIEQIHTWWSHNFRSSAATPISLCLLLYSCNVSIVVVVVSCCHSSTEFAGRCTWQICLLRVRNLPIKKKAATDQEPNTPRITNSHAQKLTCTTTNKLATKDRGYPVLVHHLHTVMILITPPPSYIHEWFRESNNNILSRIKTDEMEQKNRTASLVTETACDKPLKNDENARTVLEQHGILQYPYFR